MLATTLASWLEDRTEVTKLLASRKSIRTGKEPQGNPPPFITIRTIRDEEDTYSGATPGFQGIKEQQVEFLCEAKDTEVARSIARAIKTEIETSGRGDLGSLGIIFINSYSQVSIEQRPPLHVQGRQAAFPGFTLNVTYHYTEL